MAGPDTPGGESLVPRGDVVLGSGHGYCVGGPFRVDFFGGPIWSGV
jgi:hypothetical protein